MRVAAALVALSLLGLRALPAVAHAQAAPGASEPARIEGTISVTINSSRLKHWGVPGGDAAFVPDADRTAEAERIRAASSAEALCKALSAMDGRDTAIAHASVDGDADLNHHSGDEELLRFVVVVPHAQPATHGRLYICSHPVFAMMSKGAYPTESFYQVSGQGPWWSGYRVSLRPGERLPVHLTASLDASGW